MKFSVVIPTYNEEKYLSKSLEALKNQDIPSEEYEIIVVDYKSTDRTVEIATAAGCKVVQEKQKGCNSGRHRGFLVSQGEIIAFLDADCEPPTNWLSSIRRELEKPGVVAVSGPYDYGFNSLMRSADRFYTGYIFSHVDSWLYTIFRKKAGVIMGGNFGVWKNALVATGGVTPLPFGGEDVAIAMMLSRKAGKVVFNPQLVIKSSPRRFEREGLTRTVMWYMFSFFRVYFMNNFPQYQEIE